MKKMRRLIPAFAMLLVSAIMLTTASYAWFTSTDKVTATGVQLQAEATGSLLISREPMDAASGKTTVDIGMAAAEEMAPRAFYTTATGFKGATLTTTQAAIGWYEPDDGLAVDQYTGLNAGAFKAAGASYIEEMFYIATSGETMAGATLTITLTSPVHPSTGETHKAYAAAIYVYDKTANEDQWDAEYDMVADDINAPKAIIFVDDANDRNVLDITNVTIPTVYGATGESKVGLKVVVHYYVDGGLTSVGDDNKVSVSSTTYTAAGTVAENVKYYTFDVVEVADNASVNGLYTIANKVVTAAYGEADADETYYKPAEITPSPEQIGEDAPDGWYTAATSTSNVNYAYVRSSDVQLDGSSLKLEFSAKVPEN